MMTPNVKPLTDAPTAHPTLDPTVGSGDTLALALAHEAEVYEADPTGGQPSRY